MALVSKKVDPIMEGRRYAHGSRTGVRTAANFIIQLGFLPSHIRVSNLTTRAEALQRVDANLDGGANAKGQLSIATGVTTYADTGITVNTDGKGFTVVVATAALETNDADVYWEAWA